MIKKISVINPEGSTLVLNLASSIEEVGLAVVTVSGLGPPDAVINTIGGANLDGSTMNSKRVNSRNVTMSLVVIGTGLTGELNREKIYTHFPIKGEVTLLVETTRRTYKTVGAIEKCTINMWDGFENADISILCPDSFLTDIEGSNIQFSGTESKFEFPFSNESLVEPLISFGERLTYVYRIIGVGGAIEIGVVIDLHIVGPVEKIYIYNITSNQTFIIDTSVVSAIVGGPLVVGDDIRIDTRQRRKSVVLTRQGIEYNIFNSIVGLFANWITLIPGLNEISYNADVGVNNIYMDLKFEPAYGGV